MVTFTLLLHGFSLAILNLGLFVQMYESLHVRRNQYVVALFWAKSLGSFFAVLLGNSVTNALQVSLVVRCMLKGSWGTTMAFAALACLGLMVMLQMYLMDSPLYLLAMGDEARLSTLLQYMGDLEYNQFWHILPNRGGATDVQVKVNLRNLPMERFEEHKVGRFWLTIPEMFGYSVTACLIFFWSVHQQNVMADDEYHNIKIQFLFYVCGVTTHFI